MDWKRLGWALLIVLAGFAVIGLVFLLIVVSKGLALIIFGFCALVGAAYNAIGYM